MGPKGNLLFRGKNPNTVQYNYTNVYDTEQHKMWSRLATQICHFFRLLTRNQDFFDKKCRNLTFRDKKCRISTFRDKKCLIQRFATKSVIHILISLTLLK